MEFGIFVVLALPAFDIDPEIIRSGSCRLWSPLRSDLPGLLLAAAHEGRPRLLDLTFGRQILGNCWLCRASVIPKWAWVRRNGLGSIITKLCMKRHAGCFV